MRAPTRPAATVHHILSSGIIVKCRLRSRHLDTVTESPGMTR